MQRTWAIVVLLISGAVASLGQCPAVSINGPQGLTIPGESITLSVEVGITGPQLVYLWSVTNGEITGGQGTTKITVKTTAEDAGKRIDATVRVDGLPKSCPATMSESYGVAPPIVDRILDSWVKLKPNDQRARLDGFFSDLTQNPQYLGVILLKVTHQEKLDASNSRVQFILKHAKYRKLDTGRLQFVLELSDEQRTNLYVALSGDETLCSGCVLVRGERVP